MIQNVTKGDLHSMDMGTHMYLMEEWNEVEFDWKPAQMVIYGRHTIIVQEFQAKEYVTDPAMLTATYVNGDEGKIISLRVFDDQNPRGHWDFVYTGGEDAN